MNRKKSVDNTGVKEFNREEVSREIGVEIPPHIKNEEELCIWGMRRAADAMVKLLEKILDKQKQD